MNNYKIGLIGLAMSLSSVSCTSVPEANQKISQPAQLTLPTYQSTEHKLIKTSWTPPVAATNINRPVSVKRAVRQSIRQDNPRLLRLSQRELSIIGDKIFNNESGGDREKLVHWNANENFAAMGIGHWTWYPSGRKARFGNSFPQLLSYMENNGVTLPRWLSEAKRSGAPWISKAEQDRSRNSPQVQQLKRILYETRDLQAKFILQRAKRAIPGLIKAAPSSQRDRVIRNVEALMNTAGGRYALIDYINFKGEGLKMNGGYKKQNWGVLQVLLTMRPTQQGPRTLNEFANAAMYILERRVRNSPKSRNEARWLRGWSNRIDTYRNPWV